MSERLYSPKKIREVMNQAGVHFKKEYGQNFLIDGNIVRSIADLAEITADDVVFEVGPGIGTMTEELLLRAKKVVAVEIDTRLIPILEQQFGHHSQFRLICGDALKVDWQTLLEEELEQGKGKVVANLPYYITTPLLKKFFSLSQQIESLTLMVQKEFAQRLIAPVGTKDYGSLTLFAQCYSQIVGGVKAPKEVFLPRPKVDSMVVHLEIHPLEEDFVDDLTHLIHCVFQQRRKQIGGSLTKLFAVDRTLIRQILSQAGVSENARPEELSLQQFRDILQAKQRLIS